MSTALGWLDQWLDSHGAGLVELGRHIHAHPELSGAWESAPALVESMALAIAQASGAQIEVAYRRGVPPVLNDPAVLEWIRAGVKATLGADAVTEAEVSMGGEDFAWYLDQRPGAMGRLGVRVAGGPDLDLHRADFDVDETAIAAGVRTLVGTVFAAFAML